MPIKFQSSCTEKKEGSDTSVNTAMTANTIKIPVSKHW